MAALAPFLELRNDVLEEGVGQAPTFAAAGVEGSAPPAPDRTTESTGMAAQIAERNRQLAVETEISDDLRYFIDELADELIDLPEGAPLRVDPYFLLAAQRALIGSLRALDSDDTAYARRQMRVRLEQLRHVYRDLAEGEIVYGDHPPREIAQWLSSVLEVSQARLAELVGVSARTFQRWLSEGDRVAPEGEDARRLRIIAAATNHLRHVLTGPGVVLWFEQPNPALEGLRPAELLGDPAEAPRISTVAASARSLTAS